MKDLRELILTTLDDLVTDFLYYERKEDDELPVGAIEGAIKDHVISIEDLTERFGDLLWHSLSNE